MSFSVTGRSSAIAIQIACQAVVVFAGTLTALFGFSMGAEALFIGAACGQLVALLVCLVTLLRHRELARPSGYWLRQALVSTPSTATAGFMDGARNFGESLMLTSAAGLGAVGILSHARIYFNLLNMFASAVAQSIWAKSLQDARDPRSTFAATRRTWAPVQVAFGCAAVISVFFGRTVVELISNGKLTEAGDFIPVFFMLALIQNSEQPAVAVVFSSGRGAAAVWFRSLLVLVALITLYPTIALFGVKGLLVTAVVECCILRVFLRRLASRERRVPFQDQIGALGCLVIAFSMAYQHVATPPLTAQLVAVALGTAVIAGFGGRSVGQAVTALRELLAPQPGPRRVG
jgi:O-antigen/teichoic acid export membrane protein